MSSAPRIVRVNIPNEEYEITVEPGLLREVGGRLRELSDSKKAAVVSDSRVGPLWGGELERSLEQSGFDVFRATVPAGEDNKSLASIASVYDQVLAAAVERSTPLVALGGGVVGDMAGFAAATILRGLPFVPVPTTLLSMVDASVGGKTGINHALGKNLIGAFHQPMAVFIDPAVLKTLPAGELRGGLAECIKHEIIRDASGFEDLERNIDRVAAMDLEYLADLVAHNVSIKARVVENDPLESGERAHLNFGHTFAHAIETVSQHAIAHGEAVAMGMVAAVRCAVRIGILDEPSAQRVERLVARAGLPTGGLTLDVDQVVSAMIYDKKVRSGRVRFVLPDRIGHVVIRDDVAADVVREAAASLRG